MPSFEHQGAHIYYEEFGQGFPILTFAPAGLASTIAVWSEPSAPINPTTEWAANYRVIAMDQRNAGGQSRAPLTARDGWDSYTADHIALLDHLRIDRCHLYGQCIGGSFILNLIKTQPERVQSAVLAQPIGRVGAMAPGRPARFNAWAESLNGPPGSDTAGARCALPQPLRTGFCLLRRPQLCEDGAHTVHGAGRQRRGASLPDLRGAVEADPELRVHYGVEGRGGADLGESAHQGVPRQAHAVPRLAPVQGWTVIERGPIP